MNGHACCILGVCCPPGSAAQRSALADELVKDGIVPSGDAMAVATWVLQQFDLAPAGSLASLKSAVAEMARK